MKLIFIYNAGSGMFDKISDYAHKLLAPKTYSCSLCMLTHGQHTVKDDWKEFLDSLPYEMEFYHKDEMPDSNISVPGELPAVLMQRNGETTVFLSSEELNGFSDLEELIRAFKQKLAFSSK